MAVWHARIPTKKVLSALIVLLLAGLGSGCGHAALDVDKAALYTPE